MEETDLRGAPPRGTIASGRLTFLQGPATMRVLFKPKRTGETAAHYDEIMAEQREHPFWGKQRFAVSKVLSSRSIQKYFTPCLASRIGSHDAVLDVGCGSGMFLPILAPQCRRLVAVDVSTAFIESSRKVVSDFGLANVEVVEASSDHLPFGDGTFEAVTVIDVLHHLYHLEASIVEITRVLKPGGRLVIFEPNKLNLLLCLGCLLDRNEWGLLRLGRKGIYRRLLRSHLEEEHFAYNGLVIGPDNRLFLAIADLLDKPWVRPWLGWAQPKLFMVYRKPS